VSCRTKIRIFVNNAARALGLIGEGAVSAVPTLMQALQDQDWGVRNNAALALG